MDCVPLIDIRPRNDKTLNIEQETERQRHKVAGYQTGEEQRHIERDTVEWVNGWLKDEFGVCSLRF